ncbi:hypothetical protein C7T35_34460 [Variovorax sp. WS11]|uniref:hypothetical protein n=1 Tax=Variovorax sp. WS11 TaxID=1105204 RepID=UPI000D0E0186|nr:hypothetical protein [Variovorax sp. WS11]NDZ17792.1 hypothetical protein [Variovorax sp. WS11]PSL80030.1 hypothetical protein C7T35_34460 [Variovorax sp. WS11]
MHKLHLDERWLEEIAAIRDSVTEESGLIRDDGARYRICRLGPAFTVELFPSFSRADEGIELVFDPQDLYCHRVGGHASGRYPSTLDKVTRNVHGIDAAIRGVPRMNDVRERFEPQMLLVFCVAESLRFDRIAVVMDQIIRAGTGRGGQHHRPTLETGPLFELFKNWGSVGAAVWRAVSAGARALGALPLARLTQEQREHTEAVALLHGDMRWRDAALAVRAIKPPSA